MPDDVKSISPPKHALYSGIAAALAFIACNGLIVVSAVLTIFGISLNINPHVQALLISVFAILASVFVFKGYRQHRKSASLILAVAGVALIILTIYISFSKFIESAGLLALFIAVGWNWHALRQKSSRI